MSSRTCCFRPLSCPGPLGGSHAACGPAPASLVSCGSSIDSFILGHYRGPPSASHCAEYPGMVIFNLLGNSECRPFHVTLQVGKQAQQSSITKTGAPCLIAPQLLGLFTDSKSVATLCRARPLVSTLQQHLLALCLCVTFWQFSQYVTPSTTKKIMTYRRLR